VDLLSVSAVVLLAWGVITLVRRIAESEEAEAQVRRGRGPRGEGADAWDLPEGAHTDDANDLEELQRAEDEVRGLDADVRPEDGWEGDDWGPGVRRRPPLV